MARVKSRSSFFPGSETKQKSLLLRLMRHEIYNYFFFFGRWAIWCQLSNYDHRYQLRSLHGDYFLLGCPLGQRSIKKYLLFISKKDQMADGISRKLFMSLFPWGRFLRGGDASFQVVWRTDLEVDLERTQNYFVELLALYLRRIII